MLQQDWIELRAPDIDRKATCSLGMYKHNQDWFATNNDKKATHCPGIYKLNQDWLSHHLGENGIDSHVHVYLKVPITGNFGI